jgi:hypothetical protein
MTITSVVTAKVDAGDLMTFTINNFQNPYNGIPKGGFFLTIYESTGLGIIDQTSELFVTTSTFTSLTGAALSRYDTNTEVQAASRL